MPLQLLLRPLPQPPPQLPIIRELTTHPRLSNRAVVATLLDHPLAPASHPIPPLHRRNTGPRLIQRAHARLRRRSLHQRHHQIRQPGMGIGERVGQIRRHAAGMDRDRGDGRMPLGQLAREQDVGQLALPVPRPGAVVVHVGLDGVGEEAGVARRELVAYACEVDDSDVGILVWGGGGAGGLEGWEEELGQEEVAHVVGAELDFIAVFCQRRGLGHDAGVVHQDVEPGVFLQKGLRGGSDGREGGEVEFEVFDDGGGVGDGGRDAFHGGIVFGLGAGAEVDLCGIVWCEMEERLIAQASVGTGDDDDLA